MQIDYIESSSPEMEEFKNLDNSKALKFTLLGVIVGVSPLIFPISILLTTLIFPVSIAGLFSKNKNYYFYSFSTAYFFVTLLYTIFTVIMLGPNFSFFSG